MSGPLARAWDGWERFWFTPTSTAPLELFRIGFGATATVWMLTLVPVLGPFFGADGAVPVPDPTLPAWNLLAPLAGTPWIWALWALGLVGAVALTVGFGTRLAALAVFVVMLSLTRQGPLVFNAGDGLLRILAFYLVLAPAGSAVSLDRWRRDPAGVWDFPQRAPWALRLVQIQVSVVYLAGVWEKSAGALWRDGTAVSFALRVGDITRVPVPSFVTDSLVLTQLATYGTLALELAIGVLVWNRAARPWVLALGVLLHVSIELSLAVGFFGVGMLVTYLAFLSPDTAERVLRRVPERARGHRRTRTATS